MGLLVVSDMFTKVGCQISRVDAGCLFVATFRAVLWLNLAKMNFDYFFHHPNVSTAAGVRDVKM